MRPGSLAFTAASHSDVLNEISVGVRCGVRRTHGDVVRRTATSATPLTRDVVGRTGWRRVDDRRCDRQYATLDGYALDVDGERVAHLV